MTRKTGLAAFAMLGIVSVGCKDETVESEDIRTSGIWASFEVLATGNGESSVKSQLRVGGDSGTLVNLTGQDKLICSVGDALSKTLAKSGDYYKGTFAADAGGTQFKFAFSRGDADEAAPNSVVTLPDAFTIGGVTDGQQVSRAAALTITWEPSTTAGDAMTWTLSGDCLFDSHASVQTDGTLTLQGEDFDATPSADEAAKSGDAEKANCTAKLCLERLRKGTLDPAFAEEEGGKIFAVQKRCVQFVSTP